MDKRILATAATVIVALSAAPALADTINFGQFGPDGTHVADSATGTTSGGLDVGFTITGPKGGGYTTAVQNSDWQGEFADASPVLWDTGVSGTGDAGAITITFDSPIQSITGISAEANDFGPFTATMQVFGASGLLGTSTFSSDNNDGLNPGSIPGFSFTSGSADITSIVISTTNDDGQGVGLGPTATEDVIVEGVPEPATWTLLLAGIGGLGAVLRSARRRTVRAIA